jgi:uncharacterized protein (TIGR02145 family)
MKSRNKIWLGTLTVIGLILILIDGCKKDESKDTMPIEYGTLTDVEGNVYKTIQIEIPTGEKKNLESALIKTQTWMAENLRTTKYNDGTSIPYEPNPLKWESAEPKCTWYNGNDATETYKVTYGALYNWYAVNTGKLCPTGWHVTSDEEWQNLGRYLMNNGYNYDGTIGETFPNKVAKSLAAKTDWASSSNVGAQGNTDYPEKRNVIGFSALPGGFIFYSMGYQRLGLSGFWWSSGAGVVNIDFDDSAVIPQTNPSKLNGCSIRCIMN